MYFSQMTIGQNQMKYISLRTILVVVNIFYTLLLKYIN